MGWLLSYTLGSFGAAYVIIKIFDYLATEAGDAVRGAVFRRRVGGGND